MMVRSLPQRLLRWLVMYLVLLELLAFIPTEGRVYYSFKRYPFKKKQKNERKIRVHRQVCEDTEECRKSVGLDQIKCVRTCMSAQCYEELYGHDELEDGEIDVRYNSFKGCVLQGLSGT